MGGGLVVAGGGTATCNPGTLCSKPMYLGNGLPSSPGAENLPTAGPELSEWAPRVIRGLGTGEVEAAYLWADASWLRQPGYSVARAASVGLGNGSVAGPVCHVSRGTEPGVPCSYSGVSRSLKPGLTASSTPKSCLPLAQTTGLAQQEISVVSVYNHQT